MNREGARFPTKTSRQTERGLKRGGDGNLESLDYKGKKAAT